MSKLGKARAYKKGLISYGMEKSLAKSYAKQYRKGQIADEDMDFQLKSQYDIYTQSNPREVDEHQGRFKNKWKSTINEYDTGK